MIKSKLISGFLFLFIAVNVLAQNIAITDDNFYTAESTAMLDIKSTSKGLLIPRLDSLQRVGIIAPATGLLVFDTDASAFFYYDGSDWLNLTTNVISPSSAGMNDALFSVVNSSGDTVFAVYQEAVEINIGDGVAKANKGGFAVGGISSGKLGQSLFLVVSPDSVRVYIDTASSKANKGGFAVGGISSGKAIGDNFLTVSDDSVRIYVSDPDAKANKGGFAVGGISSGKAAATNFMKLTPKNYFIGHESGISTTGLYNSFFGYQSGYTNGTGTNNIFSGYQSGYLNTSGSNNIFYGNSSGYSNTIGAANVFLGYQAGKANVDGDKNVFLGYQSGLLNSDGNQNVFLGYVAGRSNTSGSNNTFIGTWSGYANQDGDYNTFLGYYSGRNNVGGGGSYDGDYNTFIGYFSGYNNTSGYRNTFLGYYSGYLNTTGQRNIFIGGFAGKDNTIANDNTCVGYLTGRYATGTGNTFLGYSSGSGANGTSTGTYNTFVGNNAGNDFTSGSNNVAIGHNAGNGLTSESNKLYIEGTNNPTTPQTPLIYGDFSSDYVVINGLNNNGKTFYVDGSAGGSGNWNTKSDGRLKKNVKTIPSALNKVMQLRGVNFEWIETEKNSEGNQIGLIAQEVDKVIPEIVSKDGEFLMIEYALLTPVLIEAIKDQQSMIEDLKQENLNKTGEIKTLKSQVEELEKLKIEVLKINEVLGITTSTE